MVHAASVAAIEESSDHGIAGVELVQDFFGLCHHSLVLSGLARFENAEMEEEAEKSGWQAEESLYELILLELAAREMDGTVMMHRPALVYLEPSSAVHIGRTAGSPSYSAAKRYPLL